MLKNIIYYLGIISVIVLVFTIIEMIPFIFFAGFSGIFFLILVIFNFIFELIWMIIHCQQFRQASFYHLFLMMITIYLNFIYYQIYSRDTNLSLIRYCRSNYFFLSLFFFAVISFTIFMLYFNREEKE